MEREAEGEEMTKTDIRIGNVFDELPKNADNSIDLCLTSPPYSA